MPEVAPLLLALDQRRRDLGLSYDQLSKRCGVSRPTVQRILSGRQAAASFSNILAIADPWGSRWFDSEVAPHAETGAGGAKGEEARRPGPGNLGARRPGRRPGHDRINGWADDR